MRYPIIEEVVSEHAQDAAFLWQLRDAAFSRPHYRLHDLTKLDDRVEAHLDGLRIAGDEGWEMVRAAFLESGGPGEVFAVAVLAFESGTPERVQQVIEVGTATPEAARGLISALGWLTYEQATKHIKALLAAEQPAVKRIGIAASAIHRRNPGPVAIQAALASDDPHLKARALRAFGELGLVDFQANARTNLKAKDSTCRFWAAWSNSLLSGHKDALSYLQGAAEAEGPFAERAAQMAIRRMPPNEAKTWIRRLVKELDKVRIAIIAAGALGVPDAIPFLIEMMKNPDVARVSGESFCLITGVRLEYDKLEGQKPEAFEAGPTESAEDENVEPDRDENLAWPSTAAVERWWDANRDRFAKGTRYLLGQPITTESLRQALKTGYQRQRAAAALELAILKPGRPLFEVRAPGWRQQAML
jgi:uncharacterized protein (TIGR02270 family)